MLENCPWSWAMAVHSSRSDQVPGRLANITGCHLLQQTDINTGCPTSASHYLAIVSIALSPSHNHAHSNGEARPAFTLKSTRRGPPHQQDVIPYSLAGSGHAATHLGHSAAHLYLELIAAAAASTQLRLAVIVSQTMFQTENQTTAAQDHTVASQISTQAGPRKLSHYGRTRTTKGSILVGAS